MILGSTQPLAEMSNSMSPGGGVKTVGAESCLHASALLNENGEEDKNVIFCVCRYVGQFYVL